MANRRKFPSLSSSSLGAITLAILLVLILATTNAAQAQTFQVIHTFTGPDHQYLEKA